MKYELHNCDCLEFLKTMPDKSVDLVLTDPPYNIGIAEWDKIKNYVEWLGEVFIECQRVLKDNGQLYWWHNDMNQIAQIMEYLQVNTRFIFNSFIVWDKGDFRALSWKNPSDESDLRSWFNTCEYCLAFTFQDNSGLKIISNNTTLFKSIRDYFEKERKKTKLSYKEINEKCFFTASNGGGMASNILTPYKDGWSFPTKEKYEALQRIGICKKEYEELRQEYEELRQEYEELRYKHKPSHNHNNIWKSKLKNDGKSHPTEKPVDLMQRIILTTTDENQTIFDPFMGSGTTGVACKMLNRNFIGCEISKKYYDIAETRISKQTSPLF
jgi:DNA modification methylase